MENSIRAINTIFSKTFKDFGEIQLRHMNLNEDIDFIHNWVTKPYAKFWGMQQFSVESVKHTYAALDKIKHHEVFIGIYQNEPIFLMEKYDATVDELSNYYQAKKGDFGMHILVAPTTKKIHHFTWNIFTTILEYFFSKSEVLRIVVEPDITNEKIHVINKKAGFQYQKEIDLPNKRAALALCKRNDYKAACKTLNIETNNKIESVYTEKETSHLQPKIWKKVNQALVCKAISEFAHELLFIPKVKTHDNQVTNYFITTDSNNGTYEFRAKKQLLDHWVIDEKSIKKFQNGKLKKIDAIQFILDFKETLAIPENLLPTYLDEITSTLSSTAYKYCNQKCSSKELVSASFQKIELAMTAGHPCFVANNGRIGFNAQEYLKYAPEADKSFRIIWLAGHKNKATFNSVKGLSYNSLMHQELGVKSIAKFNNKLANLRLDTSEYLFIPVHPWQWFNKLIHVFSADLAKNDLVFLGYGNDEFSAQQSIRTLYNKSNPHKFYTKTALSILNMGFMRGLSPYYMESTPSITDWITKLLQKDEYLQKIGFTMLGEIATTGFKNEYFEQLGKINAHNKMLAALWRESPHSKIEKNQQLMTMAAFLHVDFNGNSFLVDLIKASGNSTKNWLKNYLKAYLKPLLHCFYKYEMVFMPHGENLIMVMENNTPVKVLMKDITEEVIVFNETMELPEKVKRLYTKTSDKMKVLAVFTDIFDCFFRFMSTILETHSNFSIDHFWELVAESIYEYQETQPQLVEQFKRYDLFVSEFDRCCLNRLQLQNTKQMLDLAAPIESLKLVGKLENPLTKFRKVKSQILETAKA